jgi:hypothetical protein
LNLVALPPLNQTTNDALIHCTRIFSHPCVKQRPPPASSFTLLVLITSSPVASRTPVLYCRVRRQTLHSKHRNTTRSTPLSRSHPRPSFSHYPNLALLSPCPTRPFSPASSAVKTRQPAARTAPRLAWNSLSVVGITKFSYAFLPQTSFETS